MAEKENQPRTQQYTSKHLLSAYKTQNYAFQYLALGYFLVAHTLTPCCAHPLHVSIL